MSYYNDEGYRRMYADEVQDIMHDMESDNDRLTKENEIMRIALRDITETPCEPDEYTSGRILWKWINEIIAIADKAIAEL